MEHDPPIDSLRGGLGSGHEQMIVVVGAQAPEPASVVDNYASHPEVPKWLARNPRFVMHFTSTSTSWLNMSSASSATSRQAHPARQLHQRGRVGTGHRPVRCPSQHRTQAVHLDSQRQGHPGQGNPGQSGLGRRRGISTEQSGALHYGSRLRRVRLKAGAAQPACREVLARRNGNARQRCDEAFGRVSAWRAAIAPGPRFDEVSSDIRN